MNSNERLINELESLTPRKKWNRGVKAYALELVESAETEITKENANVVLLNGNESWRDYSWNGCALIYDNDIITRLATAAEVEQYQESLIKCDQWLDVQARALEHAYKLIIFIL